jgi:DNA-binding response OmpR family regulator
MDKTILIAATDAKLASALALACQRNGWVAMTASNEIEAFDMLHDLHFDLAVLDPGFVSFPSEEIQARCRQVNPNVTVFCLESKQDGANEKPLFSLLTSMVQKASSLPGEC